VADPIVIAISEKGMKSLEGTELHKLISGGIKLEGDSVQIDVDAAIDAKLEAARTERGGKHAPAVDRLIVKVSEARTRGEAEAALRGER